MADAGRLDLDQHLAGPRAVQPDRLDGERRARLVRHRRADIHACDDSAGEVAMKPFLLFLWLALSSAAHAAYPEKPITLIVAYSPGGGTDVVARAIAPYLEKYLGGGAKIVITNRAG